MTPQTSSHSAQEDDEIDLRALIHTLIKGWRLVALVTFAAALAGLAVALVWPPNYQATALVTVVQPRYSLELEGVRREAAPALRSYSDLATSDEVLLRVLEAQRDNLLEDQRDLAGLRSKLRITTSTDGTLLQFIANDGDPNLAAALANAWARSFLDIAQEVYGPGVTTLSNYDIEVRAAQSTLKETETQLADFQVVNQAPVISTTLSSLQFQLGDLLIRRFEMEQLLNDTQDMRTRLQAYAPATPLSVSDELAVLLLNARATGGQGVQLQFQLGSGPSAAPKLAAEAMVQVDELIRSLEARVADLHQQAEALHPEILEVQGQLALVQAQESELLRARALAEVQYLRLDAKVREVQVAAQEAEGLARLASIASTPTRPADTSRALVAVGAAVAGLVLAALWVLARAWWQGDAQK